MATPFSRTLSDNCDKELVSSSSLDQCLAVSPTPSTASTSHSSLFFGPASSLNSLNSSCASESETKSASCDLDCSLTSSSKPVATDSRVSVAPSMPSSKPLKMGQANQARSPRACDPLARTRLKESNQTASFPCRIRLPDGEERALPAHLRNSYSTFQMFTPGNVITAPPNRTVDHSVCENFDEEHRCLGDAGCLPCPPAYGSHLGDSFCRNKKNCESSKSGKIKEVIKAVFGLGRATCRNEQQAGKAKTRSSSCSNDAHFSRQTRAKCPSEPVAVNCVGDRRNSPPAPMTAPVTGMSLPQKFSEAPPTYDAVMKEEKAKRK